MESLKHIQSFDLFETETRYKGSEIFVNKAGKDFWGDRGAGILPCALDDEGVWHYLVALRGPESNEPDTWGVWGGMIDKGEKPETAMKREFGEEAGYDEKKDGKIKIITSVLFKTEGFEYYNYLGVIPKKFTPDLRDADAWETTEAKWVTWDEMLKLKLHFGLKYLIDHWPKASFQYDKNKEH